MSDNQIINVMTVIDTTRLLKIANPSHDPKHPTPIAHNYAFMVVTDSEGTRPQNQGTGNLVFHASVTDSVRWAMASEYNNCENPVIIYDITHTSGKTVLGAFRSTFFEVSTPVPGTEKVLPPRLATNQDYWFYEADVQMEGQETYGVSFALFKTGTTQVHGYYHWDPTIIVQSA